MVYLATFKNLERTYNGCVFFAFMPGKILTKPLKNADQFPVVDDFKLKASLIAMADRYDELAREKIYKAYTDPQLMSLYRGMRASSAFDKGGKTKVRKKILMIPPVVMDFLEVVMGQLYGPNWLQNKRALRHPLVRPWWVCDRI